MKTKTLISLVVGITFVVLGPATWAAGHGGGGGGGFGGSGFSGGGGGHGGGARSGGSRFGGGGFHGGAFRGGGLVAGGVGTRGAGVGFGGARIRGGAPTFEGAGPRFSSFGHPSHAAAQVSGARAQASRPEVARQSNQRFPGLRDHIVARQDANWHNDWDRRHAHFDHGRFFVFIDGFWCGLDDGFFPWDYLPYYSDDYYPYDYYTNVDPYDYNGTTYNVGSADSATVQAVQTQLAMLGYYSGSIDGVFGPSTRDALAKFQIVNRLNVTGSLSPDTLQSLGVSQATASWTKKSDHDETTARSNKKVGSTGNWRKWWSPTRISRGAANMSKLDSAIAAVCITIIAVSWGGYAKDYLIENQRLEQSRNAVRIMELMQRSGLSPTPFQKPLIEIDPSKASLEKLWVIPKTARCSTLIANPVAVVSVDLIASASLNPLKKNYNINVIKSVWRRLAAKPKEWARAPLLSACAKSANTMDVRQGKSRSHGRFEILP
jgi:hypothetical protein